MLRIDVSIPVNLCQPAHNIILIHSPRKGMIIEIDFDLTAFLAGPPFRNGNKRKPVNHR
jgi:hypothetical protein